MESKNISKKELIDEIHKLNIWRKRSFYESWSKEQLLHLYNGYIEVGKIQKKTSLELEEETLLKIRGTLRLLSEDKSQNLATVEDLNEMIISLGGKV